MAQSNQSIADFLQVLKSASDGCVAVTGKVLLFIQLGNLQVLVHFGVVDNMAVPLLNSTLFIDRFVGVVFPMKRGIIPVRSRAVTIPAEYMPPSDSLTTLRWDTKDVLQDRPNGHNEQSAPV